MEMKLLVLAKSDKNNGYYVVGVNRFGKFIRLVKNSKGHALAKERCNFNKMNFLIVDVMLAPLTHQKENYILSEIINSTKSIVQTEDLQKYIQNPEFVFSNTNPWVKVVQTGFTTVFANDIRSDAKAAWVSYFKKNHEDANNIYHIDSIVDLVKRAKEGEKIFPESILQSMTLRMRLMVDTLLFQRRCFMLLIMEYPNLGNVSFFMDLNVRHWQMKRLRV